MGETEPVLWCPGQLRSLQFPGAESPRPECFIYCPVSLDKGFCFIDFFFFCICCIKHSEAFCSRNALGIAGIFPCPFNAQKDQGKTLHWIFFLLRISGRHLQLHTKRMKHPILPRTPSSSLTGQPSHHRLLWHYSHLSCHRPVFSWREITLDFLSFQGKTRDQCFFLA